MNRLTCEAVARAALGEPLKRKGPELIFRCPHSERHSNGDAHPSLKVNTKKNLWACFPCNAKGKAWAVAAFLAGLDAGDKAGVTAWLKKRGLLNGAKRPRKRDMDRNLTATYTYTDACGTPVARKLRYQPKNFSWQRWENETWLDGLAGIKTPLYRLREIQDEQMVAYVEGEKAADLGAKLGLATTTAGGVNTFRLEHTEALRGKDVVIFPDNDPPGLEHAQRVAASLQRIAKSIRLVELPSLPQKGDLYDYVEAGGTRESLLKVISNAPVWRACSGNEILDSAFALVRRYLSLRDCEARVVVLWAAHTHAFDAADFSPYLSITSAEKECGKSRLLELLKLLVAKPWYTGRVSAAVLIRKTDAEQPTLLLDETDAAFGGARENAETLRGVLNTGYERNGTTSCCVSQGANYTYKDFSTFSPKAIAGIGKLPDTVASRSIPIRLRRAARGTVPRLRQRDGVQETFDLRARLATWCQANVERLRNARPVIPCELSDRQADCCEPLVAIADAAGGDWPDAARRSLVELCVQAQAGDESVGVRLLADIRDVFQSKAVDRLSSTDLASALAEIETSPWGEWSKGKPLTAARLARLLNPYEIFPDTIRIGEKTPRGYEAAWFQEVFRLYLSFPAPQSVTVQQPNTDAGSADFSKCNNETDVTGRKCENANKNGACCTVALSKAGTGVEEEL
jgi:hypothetical protein